VHIPFCVSKCHYCDFESSPGCEPIFDDYVGALIKEIEAAGRHSGASEAQGLKSVYLGGGTPTVLSADQLSSVLAAIGRSFGLAFDCEITLEANPGTVDQSKLAQLRAANFNRLSLGVQSFDDDLLTTLGRAHTAGEALDAYDAARSAGFGNIGIDLIFALPGHTLSQWNATLDTAVALNPEHVSLYELTVERGTRFADLHADGLLELAGEDTQIEMYDLAVGELTAAGFEHYEVSNFARPGFRSRHNQVYWRNEPYYGFGAGAASYIDGTRAHRTADPRAYIDAISRGSSPIDFSEHLSGRALLAETVILGLRTSDGISLSRILEETGTDLCAEFAAEIDGLCEQGLTEIDGDCLRVTRQGLFLLNDVSEAFVVTPSERQ